MAGLWVVLPHPNPRATVKQLVSFHTRVVFAAPNLPIQDHLGGVDRPHKRECCHHLEDFTTMCYDPNGTKILDVCVTSDDPVVVVVQVN